MANYIPTDWKDEIVDGAGNVVQKGTPLSAANLKNLEVGVEDAVAGVVGKVDGAVFNEFKTATTTQLAEKAKHVPLNSTTSQIQSILNNYRTILFLDGTYNVNQLNVRSNTTIHMSPKTVLKANPGFTIVESLFNIQDAINVVIHASHATIQMLKSEYTSGESRHCIRLFDSKSVTINDLHCMDSGGDGFYVGGGRPCENITLNNCFADNNRRQGLSIVNVKGINVNGGKYENTVGTSPEAGIDIEPNYPGDYIQNVNIKGVNTKNNAGAGIYIILNEIQTSVSINIDDCLIEDDSVVLSNAPTIGKVTGTININNIQVLKPKRSGVTIQKWNENAPDTVFKSVRVIDPGSGTPITDYQKSGFVLIFTNTDPGTKYGNVEFIDCAVEDTREVPITFIPFFITSSRPVFDINLKNFKGNKWTHTNLGIPIVINSPSIENVEVSYKKELLNKPSSHAVSKNEIGTIIVNTSTNQNPVHTLPSPSNVLGAVFTFRVEHTGALWITPQVTDTIRTVSSVVGGRIKSSLVGSSITLKAISPTEWQVVDMIGAWDKVV